LKILILVQPEVIDDIRVRLLSHGEFLAFRHQHDVLSACNGIYGAGIEEKTNQQKTDGLK
jgi:hypothetical protein